MLRCGQAYEGVGECTAYGGGRDRGNRADAGGSALRLRQQLAKARLRRVGEVLQQPTHIRMVRDLHAPRDTNACRELRA